MNSFKRLPSVLRSKRAIRLIALAALTPWLLNAVSSGLSARPQVGASRTALATVIDQRGRPFVDIETDDFVVRETGRTRDVLSVRVADYPIALVLDNSAASRQDFPEIREAAARFARRVGARPIAVALADPPRLVATFDDDRGVVLDRIEKTQAREQDKERGPSTSSGSSRTQSAEAPADREKEREDSAEGSGLIEAIVAAAKAVQDSGSLFAAIVVLSADISSAVPTELLTPILNSGATLNVVVNVSGVSGGGSSAPILREAAQRTQGQYTSIFSAASYQIALERLADRLAPELMIEYLVPPGSSTGDDVQLGVKIPGARVVGIAVK